MKVRSCTIISLSCSLIAKSRSIELHLPVESHWWSAILGHVQKPFLTLVSKIKAWLSVAMIAVIVHLSRLSRIVVLRQRSPIVVIIPVLCIVTVS